MLDFAQTDSRLLDDVALVVDELVSRADVDPDAIMLVGARCRDAIHSALGATEPTRSTDDLDIGVALSDWDAFDRIDKTFARTGSNGIRYLIEEMPVDVMPFGGDIESPDGITTPARRGETLVVFGFEDVFARAARITLPGDGHRIRIPMPAGYGALKARAWVDRSQDGEYKDAGDIGIALGWYDASTEVQGRLWEESREPSTIELYEYDPVLATAHTLGRDIRRQLTEDHADELTSAFGASDLSLFARYLGDGRGDLTARREVTLALHAGLSDGG